VPLALFLLCLLATLAGGCGGDSRSAEPSPTELTGLITEVEPETGPPEKFLLEVDGEGYELHIAPEIDYGFDLAHLREHLRQALPVRCQLEERGGELYALEIVDA
jgi:hypothetical protein